MDEPVTYTPIQVAGIANKSKHTIYRLINAGEIPSIALGRTKSIPAWWVKETFFEKSVQRTVSSTSEDDLQS